MRLSPRNHISPNRLNTEGCSFAGALQPSTKLKLRAVEPQRSFTPHNPFTTLSGGGWVAGAFTPAPPKRAGQKIPNPSPRTGVLGVVGTTHPASPTSAQPFRAEPHAFLDFNDLILVYHLPSSFIVALNTI